MTGLSKGKQSLALTFLSLSLLHFAHCSNEPGSDSATMESTGAVEKYAFLNLDPQTKYTGDEECVLCHSEIYRTFKQTGMGRSFYLPDADDIIEDYIENNTVFDAQKNLYYQVIQKTDGFYQLEFRLDEDKNRTHELLRKIDFIVGSGNHNRSYISSENGFLLQMPVTWYSEKKIWDLSPGYHDYNFRFARPIVPECMNCHNSYAEHIPFSENQYGEVPHGIGCERCHGPGDLHVEFRSQAKLGEPAGIGIDSTIVNPKHLPANLQMDVCRQCHLQGEIRVIKEEKTEADFRPGMKLTEVKSIYIRDKVPSGDFRIASHGARLSLSACFTKSQGGMVCTTCHNPHEPVQWLERSFFNEKCLGCHQLETLSQANEAARHHLNSDCVSCHMKQGATEDILHVNFTDHWIRKEVRKLSQEESKNLREQTQEITMRDFFDEADPAAEIRLGIAYVEYFEAKNRDGTYLNRALPYLQSGLLQVPEHTNGLYFLGKAYYHLMRFTDAFVQFQKLTEVEPQNALAHFQLARTLQNLDRHHEAIEVFKTSLAIFGDNAVALNNLANSYAAVGNETEARLAYEKALRIKPSYTLAHNNLGDLWAFRVGDAQLGQQYFERALELDPDFVSALHNLGSIHLGRGDGDRAIRYYRRVIAIDPGFAPAYGNLAIIHIRNNENAEAKRYLQKLLQLRPEDTQALALLRQLEQD